MRTHAPHHTKKARPLSVDADLEPVVAFLREQGLSGRELVAALSAHPPVLCYDVEARLRPFFDYLRSIGALCCVLCVLCVLCAVLHRVLCAHNSADVTRSLLPPRTRPS